MSLTYTTYVAQLANLMVTSTTDPNFVIFLPGCIDYAEQRIYRELDLLYAQVTDSSAALIPNNRNFTLPVTTGTFSGIFITVDQINLITPAGTSADAGSRNPLSQSSREMVDAFWPSSVVGNALPNLYAMKDSGSVIVGPPPDAAYMAEVIGIQRPSPLSPTNTTTILTSYIPDVFIAASMVFASGYMRNFGSQADDPKMAASWESQYQSLKASAAVEQFRAKFQSQGWSSDAPTPLATATR